MAEPKLDQLCVDTIRLLPVDTVQQANSGHSHGIKGAELADEMGAQACVLSLK